MSWAEATASFRTAMPNYEERLSQTRLAQAMEQALESGTPLLGQAPPGTGKSFPAIITLLDRARKLNQPCVAATATKALQDQYIADCQFIKDNYDPAFRFMVLKGRGNYLCKAKMAKADEVLLDLPVTLDEMERVALDDAVLGDVERLGFPLTSTQKRNLTTTSDECPGKSTCPFGSVCFAEKAKAKAENADVIVVNHALLAIDATLKAEGIALLPMYPALVVDEAHELRGYVESALSVEMTQRSFTQLNTEVCNFINDNTFVPIGEGIFASLFQKFDNVLGRDRDAIITPAILTECSDQIIAVIEHLDTLGGKVAVVRADSDDAADRKKRLRKRVTSTLAKMRKIVLDDFASTVRWVERDRVSAADEQFGRKSRGILLCTGPLDVGPFMAAAVWEYTTPLLISATLAIGDDFTYMAREMGLEAHGEYATFDCPTPFDFSTQAITYIPEDMPDVRNNVAQFRAAFAEQSWKLIKAANGRTMLLFTSWDALNDAYNTLALRIKTELGHTVFRQGDMGSTRALANAFRDDEHSVLFATKTFFTGVNIEGDSLRCLIIQKCPFHYPDVLWRARCEAIDAVCTEHSKWTKGSFPMLQVPDMTMTLIQGYGRLIRTLSDRGLVAIFDSALSLRNGKKYGKTLRANHLPPAPIVSDIDEACAKLIELEAEVA